MKISLKGATLSRYLLLNTLLVIALSCRYLVFLPEFPQDTLTLSYLVTALFSHSAMLVALVALLLVPALFLPAKFSRLILSGVATFGLVLLYIDTLVYEQYRFHINWVMIDLLTSGQIVSFPLIAWIKTTAAILILWGLQWGALRLLESKKRQPAKLGGKFAVVVFAAFITSSFIHIWGAAYAYQPITQIKRYLPLYQPVTATSFMRKHGWFNEEEYQRQRQLARAHKADINYPLQPLETQAVENPSNILVVMIDSWRYDTFSAEITPNLWRQAQNGAHFDYHLSTGNSTRTGIFGFFYGIPGTYWHSILSNNKSPVLMDRLQELDYQIGIFASAQLRKPEFNRTVFQNIENLREESQGNSPAERDTDLTQDWLEWYQQRDQSKPSFSFLFYDAPHGFDFPADYPKLFEPMLEQIDYLQLNQNTDPTPFFNRYKNSVHFVDSLIQKVFAELEQQGELDNTLVIITGDHGKEFNDAGNGFWGHNSNFTDYQVRVPFVVIEPQTSSSCLQNNTNAFSSHLDVAPSLLTHYLGVTSAASTYSLGSNFFECQANRDWVLVSSYNDFAIVTPETILEVSNTGSYRLLDKHNRPLKDAQRNMENLQEALKAMSFFN